MIRRLLLTYVLCPAALIAQGTPGTNIRVSVMVASLSRSGDTTAITYRIANLASSREPLFSFTVELGAAPVHVASPSPLLSWSVSSRHVDRPIAGWAALDTSLVSVGKTSPDLSFRAMGVPGIVDAHVVGWYPLPELAEDSLNADPDPLVTNAIHIRVVGVVAADPSASVASLLSRLGTLLAESCALGWVSNAGICQSLQAKVYAASSAVLRGDPGAATSQLNALINELNAQRGKQVDDNAYFLLRTNAEYIVSRI